MNSGWPNISPAASGQYSVFQNPCKKRQWGLHSSVSGQVLCWGPRNRAEWDWSLAVLTMSWEIDRQTKCTLYLEEMIDCIYDGRSGTVALLGPRSGSTSSRGLHQAAPGMSSWLLWQPPGIFSHSPLMVLKLFHQILSHFTSKWGWANDRFRTLK